MNIVNNNCGKYCSHKIELLQQKYSKNQNIIFTKSIEDITKMITYPTFPAINKYFHDYKD